MGHKKRDKKGDAFPPGSRPSRRLLLGEEPKSPPRRKKKLTRKALARVETIMDQMAQRRAAARPMRKRNKRR